MKNMKLAILVFGAVLSQTSQAQAGLVRVIQEWDSPTVATNGKTARTAATVDTGTLNGVGFERLPIDNFFVGRFLFGIGQSSNTLQSNPPLALNVDGTIFAAYIDGVFQGLRNVDNGGAARAGVVDFGTTSPLRGAVGIGDSNMIFFLPISGQEDYVLNNTQFVPIPEPATILFLGPGLIGLGFIRRRQV